MNSLDIAELNLETIAGHLHQLREMSQLGRESRQVTINVAIDGPLEPAASALLSHAILGAERRIAFTVRVSDEVRYKNLVRSGVVSALASRGGAVRCGPDVTTMLSRREFWSTWTPGAHRAMAPMFGSAASGQGLFSPSHAVFINPHLTSEAGGISSITRLIRRWIVQSVAPSNEANDHARLIEQAAFSVDQLVRNISEHAITHESPTVESMIRIEAIDSKFIQLTVVDTGPGVASTLRRKIRRPNDQEPADLPFRLLSGQVRGWGRGRGLGLSTIVEQVLAQDQASMELWSGHSRVRVGKKIKHEQLENLGIRGTVASVRLPIEGS